MAVSIPTFARGAVSGLVNYFHPPATPVIAHSSPEIESARRVDHEALAGPILRQLVWAGALADETPRACPALAAIDAARGPGAIPFASAPNAAELEIQARLIIDRSWSELVWLTGLVDQSRFDALCASLERMCPIDALTNDEARPRLAS